MGFTQSTQRTQRVGFLAEHAEGTEGFEFWGGAAWEAAPPSARRSLWEELLRMHGVNAPDSGKVSGVEGQQLLDTVCEE